MTVINKCKHAITIIIRNHYLTFGLIFETTLAVFLAYCPGFENLRFYGLRFEWWFIVIVFSLFIFIYDEIRKWLIRRYPGGKQVVVISFVYLLFTRLG